MITIMTITTAINMIPSVEPTSSTASAAASMESAITVGVAVASWAVGEGRLSARLVNAMAIPSIIQNAMRMFSPGAVAQASQAAAPQSEKTDDLDTLKQRLSEMQEQLNAISREP